MEKEKSYFIGLLASILIILNTFWWFMLMLGLGILKAVLPFSSVLSRLNHGLDKTLNGWVGGTKKIASLLNLSTLKIEYDDTTIFDTRNWYIVICNHQSWADILILQSIFWGKIPPLKFFAKKQLLWVPLLGTAMWLQGFPYMTRPSAKKLAANPELAGQDTENTRKACYQFGTRPTTVLNFLEGTRFTAQKHTKSDSNFTYLLNPKTGGFGIVSEYLGDKIYKVIDVTIVYPDGVPDFFSYLSGQCKSVFINVTSRDLPKQLASTEVNESGIYRTELRDWINTNWQAKDALLQTFYAKNKSLNQPLKSRPENLQG